MAKRELPNWLENLRELRKDKGYTQADVAKAIHISLSSYQHDESNVGMMRVERLIEVCKVIDVDIRKVFED